MHHPPGLDTSSGLVKSPLAKRFHSAISPLRKRTRIKTGASRTVQQGQFHAPTLRAKTRLRPACAPALHVVGRHHQSHTPRIFLILPSRDLTGGAAGTRGIVRNTTCGLVIKEGACKGQFYC
jgi:hypothetical protein